MPAQVMIWPNAKSVKAAGHPGHAALRIDMCDANGQRVTDQDCYISWWPGSYQDDDKHKSGPFSQRPVRTHTLEDDLQSEMSDRTRQQLTSGNIQPRQGQVQTTVGSRMEWVQLPTYVIFLPGAGEYGFNTTRLGLNLQRIREWWDVFRLAPNRAYRFVSHTMNCASVIAAALHVGGAHLFVKKKLDNWTWTTPTEIKTYSEKIRDGIMDLNQNAQAIVNSPFMSQNFPQGPTTGFGNPELWTVDQWKQQSYVSGWARRKEQVAAIDKLLQKYHDLGDWDVGNPAQFLEKWDLLKQMLEQAHDHMRHKPTSDRAQAVLNLGRQIVAVIEHRENFIGMVDGMVNFLPQN